MAFLLKLLAGWGVPDWLIKPLLAFVALIALAGLIWGGITLHDSHVVSAHDATTNAKVIEKTAPANDKASDQRATDTITNTRQAKEMHDVIHAAPDTAPAPSSIALGCLRLQRQVKSLAGIPACAGHSSSH